jgi:hypothetical protein
MLLYRMGPSIADPDLWHGMALAREMAALGHVPWEDRFAYTPTLYPVVHHEWGAGVIAYWLVTRLGGPGVVLARYTLTLALAAITLGVARRRGAGLPVLSFLAPIGILLIDDGFSTIRAQMYSFVFFSLLLLAIDDDLRGGRYWPAPILLMFLLWINVHAGFLLGVGVLGVHWAERMMRGEPHRHLLAIGLGLTVLILANPYGSEYYGYLFRSATMLRPHVSEWAPLWRTSSPADVVMFVVSLAIMAYAVAWRGARNARGLAILAVTALAGMLRSRLGQFYAVAWMAYVPAWVETTPLGASMRAFFLRRGGLLVATWIPATVILLTLLIPLRPWMFQVPGAPLPDLGVHSYYPVGAVKYLSDVGFRGNVMVPFDWGAYVSWKLHPAVKVSMDGRYEAAYPNAVAEESYKFFMGEPGWQRILTAYPTDVLLMPIQLPLARLMPEATGWRRVYADPAFVLYIRPGLTLPAVDHDPVDMASSGTIP